MVVNSTITAIVMLADSNTSISHAGSGTMITSTLAIMAIGRIKSAPRLISPSAEPGADGESADPDATKASRRVDEFLVKRYEIPAASRRGLADERAESYRKPPA